MPYQKSRIGIGHICILIFLCCSSAVGMAQQFRTEVPEAAKRVWIGPEYWANRLQDWQIADGRIECVEADRNKPMRTIHLLTHRLAGQKGDLSMSVRTGLTGNDTDVSDQAATGFLIGAGADVDYRAAALIHHSFGPGGGLFAGIDAGGFLFIRDFSKGLSGPDLVREPTRCGLPKDVQLHLLAKPSGGKYALTVFCKDPRTGRTLGTATLQGVEPGRLVGNLALVSHPGRGKNTGRFWFQSWKVSGSKLEVHADRTAGPVLSTQYTLSNNILKMTAQMMPLGESDTRIVELQIKKNRQWEKVATAEIIVPGYTATFRIENWDSTKDTPYRVMYDLKAAGAKTRAYTWSGTVRREPVDKNQIVVAAFTGNHNTRHPGVDTGRFSWTRQGLWFPHNDIVSHVAVHRADVLFFSGDQVYEGASPTAAVRAPLEKAGLDYLYKWYLWCWAFRDLTRDIPSVCIPDDHDVYHGNLWGAGGRKAKGTGHKGQDSGGYVMSAEFVNMVERTHTSHLPDAYAPTPVEQGIGVYYCAMNYGGVSFAVIEDRKFKSSPTVMIPEGKVVNGWFQNLDFDPAKDGDVPGAKLLGERQLKFLREWSADWSGGIWMKAVLSQTLFANVATLPASATSDAVVPKLRLVEPGAYPPDDKPVADADSDGWPQTGRNKALREMRRGFAVHIAGDQHLGTTIQYGVDEWHDAGFAICVPSVANFWPRRWFPSTPGLNREPDSPKYTGDFKDGFGNLFTVYAVSDPYKTQRKPASLHEKSPGYGIVKFDRNQRTIAFACWPRYADPAEPDAGPYPDWPVVAGQTDNYNRKTVGYLPTIKVSGMTDPVVQLVDETADEIVYTLRINGTSFRPGVFTAGTYTIRVGEPGTEKMKTLKAVRPLAANQSRTIEVNF